MSRYNVCVMLPIGFDVEADSFEEAIEKTFTFPITSNYGGDGIYVINKDNGETYEE